MMRLKQKFLLRDIKEICCLGFIIRFYVALFSSVCVSICGWLFTGPNDRT